MTVVPHVYGAKKYSAQPSEKRSVAQSPPTQLVGLHAGGVAGGCAGGAGGAAGGCGGTLGGGGDGGEKITGLTVTVSIIDEFGGG